MISGDKEVKNCWEFWECLEEDKKDCFVHKKGLGRSCWFIPSYVRSPKKREFQYCWECPWYKQLNPTY